MTNYPIGDMFEKDIRRPIEGVIKANDTSQLATEVEEYVLTNEAARGIEHLLESYTNYSHSNGVWISGFFGSGKSHLLKMLAHVLGDVTDHAYSRAQTVEQFKNKTDNVFLKGLLDNAERIPAKSLLFNIDQKATLITKDQTDALLKVFVKVFDEFRGFYGNQGHIAKFERDLEARNQFGDFKEAFERIAGIPWERGREQYVLESANIDRAFAEVNGTSSPGIISEYSKTYSVSIEDFANDVSEWLDQQPDDCRINFFVDEVGQFIGANQQLMLNLQTIAESLATKCRGRAWIFVTSQEDMEKIGGDRTKSQANDFSKIQGRFANRLKLTSRDVEEVIRKRLLAKNSQAVEHLSTLYEKEKENFRTLFEFVDGRRYPNFRSAEHFVGIYPFVGYQFSLFQEAIEGISDHKFFEGSNSSVGERSMLGVAQEVATKLAHKPLGHLASFDQMFEGIRAALKSANQRAILNAEKSKSLNELSVRLLKALFLVKYVEGFRATPQNLTVLVYNQFDTDLQELSKSVLEALSVLESQTYVQRNGDVYEYLTDEEQKIEQEIKNVEIESSAINKKLSSILLHSVIKSTKVPYEKNGQNFSFGIKLDDQAMSKQEEITLNFITPNMDIDFELVKSQSSGLDELRVVFPDDSGRLLTDLALYLKTDRYVKQAHGETRSPVEQTILQTKGSQNYLREQQIIERVKDAVSRSRLVHNATELIPGATEPTSRIIEGMQYVISATYTNLSLLAYKSFNEKDLLSLTKPPQESLHDEGDNSLDAAANDVLGHVSLRTELHEQTTVKYLIERYTRKPYGWNQWSVLAVLAYLAGLSKIEVFLDGAPVRGTEIAHSLRNSQNFGGLIIGLQRIYDQNIINSFRRFLIEFSDEGSITKDPVELSVMGKSLLESKLENLKQIRAQLKYPFIEQLDEPIRTLEELCSYDSEWYITAFTGADELLKAKHEIIDPIRHFLNGQQRNIYDNAVVFMENNTANLSYFSGTSVEQVRGLLRHPEVHKGARISQLSAAIQHLQKELDEIVENHRRTALDEIQARWENIPKSEAFINAVDVVQRTVVAKADAVLERVKTADQVPIIESIAANFAHSIYPEIVDELDTSRYAYGLDHEEKETEATAESTSRPTKKSIALESFEFPMTGQVLSTEVEVEEFLRQLRVMMLEALNDGKRITL